MKDTELLEKATEGLVQQGLKEYRAKIPKKNQIGFLEVSYVLFCYGWSRVYYMNNRTLLITQDSYRFEEVKSGIYLSKIV